MIKVEPYYRLHIFCCTNKRPTGHPRGCCADRDAERLRNYMKARIKELGIEGVRINMAGCLDRCELGPTMVVYPDGVWYRAGSPADIDRIIAEHVVAGRLVNDLLLSADQTTLSAAE